jgi:hypothetical protein
MRRCPHGGFSVARRTARRAMLTGLSAGGRTCAACSCRMSSRLGCDARPAAGGCHRKTPVQRLRGMSRASGASQTRSAGSDRTRLAWRRSTTFSCRSTSSSAFFAWSLRTSGQPGRVSGTSACTRS